MNLDRFHVLKNLIFRQSVMFVISSFIGYEGLEVVNPEGGTEDAEDEAKRGRWKQEVNYFMNYVHIICRY
jgi:hypothetical protein